MNKYAKKVNSSVVVTALLQTGTCNIVGSPPKDKDKDKDKNKK